MEYVIEHTSEERSERARTMLSNVLINRDLIDMLTLIDQLADLDCCCPTHSWPTDRWADIGCPGGDCDGCPDCLAGHARRIIVRLGGAD